MSCYRIRSSTVLKFRFDLLASITTTIIRIGFPPEKKPKSHQIFELFLLRHSWFPSGASVIISSILYISENVRLWCKHTIYLTPIPRVISNYTYKRNRYECHVSNGDIKTEWARPLDHLSHCSLVCLPAMRCLHVIMHLTQIFSSQYGKWWLVKRTLACIYNRLTHYYNYLIMTFYVPICSLIYVMYVTYSFTKNMVRAIMRLVWMVCGFHYVRVKGKQMTRMEAPIIVLAPHSSFVDMLPILVLGAPSIVSRIENATVPFLGSTFVNIVFCSSKNSTVAHSS